MPDRSKNLAFAASRVRRKRLRQPDKGGPRPHNGQRIDLRQFFYPLYAIPGRQLIGQVLQSGNSRLHLLARGLESCNHDGSGIYERIFPAETGYPITLDAVAYWCETRDFKNERRGIANDLKRH